MTSFYHSRVASASKRHLIAKWPLYICICEFLNGPSVTEQAWVPLDKDAFGCCTLYYFSSSLLQLLAHITIQCS